MTVQTNGSVVKAFEILGLFGPGCSEVSAGYVREKLGTNFITAHRFLRTLESVGALVAVSKGNYRLGFMLVDLGQRAADQAGLARLLQPILGDVTRDVQEASMATVFDGSMVVCIAKAASPHPLFVDIRIGSRLEAYCTAHGKLWLAHLPPAQLDRYLDTVPRQALTPSSLVERGALITELDEIRRTGVSFNRGEREADIRAVAVPVLSREGSLISGLSVFGPPNRLTDDRLEAVITRLRHAAADATDQFYGVPGIVDGDGEMAAQ